MNNGKLVYIISAFFSCLFLSAAFSDRAPNEPYQHKYVGMEKCASVCHKGDLKGRQYEIWEASKHSKAYLVLKMPAADSIAKTNGYGTPAFQQPFCLTCHVLGKDINKDEMESGFDISQGVQCESCHGPGSDYRILMIMKDRSVAQNYGLAVHDSVDLFCRTCHNEESPTFKGFNFTESWNNIVHTDPNIKK